MKNIIHEGQEFIFVENDECNCGNCIFNEMGAEGNELCRENDCKDEGYYILKPEVPIVYTKETTQEDEAMTGPNYEEWIDWDAEMKDFRESLKENR